jgi:alpha-L-rhamnosidase
MKKWLAYMRTRYMKDYIIGKDSYGDWCVPPESPEMIHSQDPARKTDPEVLATTYYYHMLYLMQRFAGILDKPADAKEFLDLSVKIKEAFNKKFYDPQTGRYSNNTVTANVLPLAFDMVKDDSREKVFRNIVDKTMIENKGHISTGVVGTQWIMRELTSFGRQDIAYGMATTREYPGWGYMVENGATTIWELWNGNTANPAMNSQNHVMLLGDLLIWFYENLGGIKTDPDQPAFKGIVMNPVMVDGLNSVNASYHSMHGTISSSWKKEGARFSWNITVPGNTKAVVYIPAKSEKGVKEGNTDALSAQGVKFLRMEAGRAVFEIGSGDYAFVSE